MADHDAIIIGAGPAGQQAALFLGRAKVRTVLVGKTEGSELAFGKVIGNYFGFPDEPSGMMLLTDGIAHVKRCGVDVLEREAVDIEQAEGGFIVRTDALDELRAKAVIIASGQQIPTAGIRGEKEFLGKGVHTCVACDGPFFRGKRVAVVGNGAHAAAEAIELADLDAKVTVFSQGRPWEMGDALERRLAEKGIGRSEKRVAAVKGERFVGTIVLADKTEEAFDGVFIATGTAGGITFGYKLGLELKDGFIVIDRDGRTSVPGAWAAGAVTGGNPQIAKSAGEGCNAAISVIRTLKGLDAYTDQT